MLLLFLPVSLSRAESRDRLERAFVSGPSGGGWTMKRPGLDGETSGRTRVPKLVVGLPGRVAAHAVRTSRGGEILAEVVLLDDVPPLDWGPRGLTHDRAIEPLPPDPVPRFSLNTALQRIALNAGALSAPLVPGTERKIAHWQRPSLEVLAFTGGLVPCWRLGIQYVNLGAGRFAVLVYRVLAWGPQANRWQQVGSILKSIRFLKPV